MDKKKIIIIILFVIAVILLGVGVTFMLGDNKNNNTLDPDTYVAEEYVFENPDEVVTFLKNIYKSDDVKIISNDGKICEIRAVHSNGTIYNYEYDIENHLLNSVDDENIENDTETEDVPAVVSEP